MQQQDKPVEDDAEGGSRARAGRKAWQADKPQSLRPSKMRRRGGEILLASVRRGFGSQLRHFARSVDIVDDRTFDEIRDLVYSHLQTEFVASYFSLAIEHPINGSAGLKTDWSSEGGEHSTTIQAAEGKYSSHISVSFAEAKPLWVVNPDRRPLRWVQEFADLWSGFQDLPEYVAPVNRDMRTSIIVPLLRWLRPIGVMYLESTSYLDITEPAKEGLDLVADALAILFDLRKAYRAQWTGTRDAITEIREILSSARFPTLTKPQIFIGSSSKADDKVLAVIREVIDEFSERLKVVQWNKIRQSGSITTQIVEEISRSSFGLCYLSEPAEKSAGARFRDNPNVVFEAGMLHSLTNDPAGKPTGWIPIREEDSPPTPFDFASERMEIVPRTGGGELIEERFRSGLRERMGRLLLDDRS